MRRAALLLAIVLTPAAGAQAATRYVSPAGAGEGPCTRGAPCMPAYALGAGSAAGDTVLIGAGTYAIDPLVVEHPLTITAAPDRARPVLRLARAGVALTVAAEAAGTVVEHVALSATAAGAVGVDLLSAASVDDVTVTTGDAACLRSAAAGVRIDDTAFTQLRAGTEPCLATSGTDTSWTGVTVTALNGETAASYSGDGIVSDATFSGQVVGLQVGGNPIVHRVTATARDRGMVLSGTTMITDSVAIARAGGVAVAAASGTHELLNLTARAQRPGSVGIQSSGGAQVIVKNTIARGVAADLEAVAATTGISGDCAAVAGCPAGQLVVDHSNFRTAPGVSDLGANQSVAPLFVDAGFEDFRLRKGSPAIDAGSFEVNSGSADRAGRFRWLGARPDIGAFEFPAPRRSPPKADRKAPTLGVVRLTATTFRAGRRGLAFSAAAAPVGTTLIAVVSEDADLVVQVRRLGRRRSLGTIVRTVTGGTHHLALDGRVDGHALAPGRYVMTVTARDVAQNLSEPRVLPFTIFR